MNTNLNLRIVEAGDFAGSSMPTVRPIAHSRELFDVYRMTYQCYRTENKLNSEDGLCIPHPEFDHIDDTTILVAEWGGEILGTISLTLDGKHGLPLDKNLNRTCALSRAEGRPLAQAWRLLAKDSCPTDVIVTSLITEATQRLLSQNIQTSLWMVQERYSPLCHMLLNPVMLTRIASARGASKVNSVLLRGDAEKLQCPLPTTHKRGMNERTPHLARR